MIPRLEEHADDRSFTSPPIKARCVDSEALFHVPREVLRRISPKVSGQVSSAIQEGVQTILLSATFQGFEILLNWLYMGSTTLRDRDITMIDDTVRLCEAYAAGLELQAPQQFMDAVVDTVVEHIDDVDRSDSAGDDRGARPTMVGGGWDAVGTLPVLLKTFAPGSPMWEFLVDVVAWGDVQAESMDLQDRKAVMECLRANSAFGAAVGAVLLAQKLGVAKEPVWKKEPCAFHAHGVEGSGCYLQRN